MRQFIFNFIFIFAAQAVGASIIVADENSGGYIDHNKALLLRKSGDILPLEKIINAAKVIKEGRIIELELEKRGDQYLYEIEILVDTGEIWEIYLDAKTAETIEINREN